VATTWWVDRCRLIDDARNSCGNGGVCGGGGFGKGAGWKPAVRTARQRVSRNAACTARGPHGFELATAPQVIVYIFLDSLDAGAHNPASFQMFLQYGELRRAPFSPFRLRGCGSCEENENAISARLDGAVFESRMSCARTLAARRGRSAGSLQQLRLSATQRAATARAALPHAAASAGELSPDRASALTGAPFRNERKRRGHKYLRRARYLSVAKIKSPSPP